MGLGKLKNGKYQPITPLKGSWAMTDKDCNCGAQDRSEHRPHKKDCAVYKPSQDSLEYHQSFS